MRHVATGLIRSPASRPKPDVGIPAPRADRGRGTGCVWRNAGPNRHFTLPRTQGPSPSHDGRRRAQGFSLRGREAHAASKRNLPHGCRHAGGAGAGQGALGDRGRGLGDRPHGRGGASPARLLHACARLCPRRRPAGGRPRPGWRGPGASCGRAGRHQGPRLHQGPADRLGLHRLRGLHARRGRRRGRAPAGGRRRHPRQDQRAGVRLQRREPQRRVRGDAQSVEPGALARRLQRGLGRRGGGWRRAAGGRQRRRRLGANSVVVLRARGGQGVHGAGAALPRLSGRALPRRLQLGGGSSISAR